MRIENSSGFNSPTAAQPLRILHLEDNSNDRMIVARLLRAEHLPADICAVETREAFLQALDEQRFDVILCDERLPAFDGMSALILVRERHPELPFIFVTGSMGEEGAIETIKSGATDYVLKDRLSRLVPAIRRAIREAEERERARKSERLNAAFSKLGETLGAATSAEEASRVIAGVADELLGWDCCYLALYSEEEKQLRAVLTIDLVGGQRRELPNSEISGAVSPLIGRTLEEGPQLILREAGYQPSGETELIGDRSRPSASLMLVPIRNAGKPIGLLSIQSYKVNAYQSADLSTLQALADYCGGTLERISAEQALRESEARLREQAALLDKAREGILVCDLNRRIFYWSRGAERVFSIPSAEAVNRTLDDVFAGFNTAALRHGFDMALEKGEWLEELRGPGCRGADLTLESSWTLLRDENGRPQSVLVINTDITEKKQLEEQFLRAQRTETLGILAGGIAHDLNNVLSPMLMVAELLRMRLQDPEQLKWLKTLEKSAERGADLVRQILLFTRGVEGERGQVQLRNVIRDTHRILEETFPRSIRIQTHVAPDLWPVTGVTTHLHQVLMNLCVNARDAMPEGGHLEIAAENWSVDECYAEGNPEAHAGPYVLLRVADTGTGIQPDVLRHMFDPFFTTKPAGQGTGLGLPTVRNIVKNHGGFLHVYSDPGRGTSIKVYLPASPSAVAPAKEQQRGEPPHGNNQLILVVDDEEPVREITRKTLELHGYRVMLAKDGIAALAQYVEHQQRIHLVLTDIMMPGMQGTALVHALRKMNPRAKILAFSGLAEANEEELAALDISVLQKPFSAEALLRTIRDELARPDSISHLG